MATQEAGDVSERAYQAFRPETWGMLAFLIAVVVGVLAGFAITFLGQSINPRSDTDKLLEASWMLGLAIGLFAFSVSLTVVKVGRRLLESNRP